MKHLFFFVAMLTAGACGQQVFNEGDSEARAFKLAQEVERLAGSGPLWPGFDPMAIPLAVYDGEHTYLFRHPAPPEGFLAVADGELAVQVFAGRFPAIVANTSSEIGTTVSATMMLSNNSTERSLTDLAAVAIHEAFHVYQREHHSSWQANEADLFVYPIDDPQLLALRRLETKALQRALEASELPDAACWAKRALILRGKRFGRMGAVFADYERRTELNEGLATYVESRALGRATVMLPASGFGATDVRGRGYATGSAFAFLLDRFSPDWAESFEADDAQNLDEALQIILRKNSNESCERFASSDAEVSDVERDARSDTVAVLASQVERREAFEAKPGWRVVVKSADGEPLLLQGFDPLNVEAVQADVLHKRFLRLGNNTGQLEIMDTQEADIEALTRGVGPHPIFNGIKEVIIVGLAKPEVLTVGERVTVDVPGLTGKFERASVHQDSEEVIVTLGLAL